MPHLILEHNSDEDDLVRYVCKKLHGCLSKQETVNIETIKTRSCKVDSLILGEGREFSLFAHLTLKLLPGRSDDLKGKISERLLDTMKKAFRKEGQFSVELLELKFYTKTKS